MKRTLISLFLLGIFAAAFINDGKTKVAARSVVKEPPKQASNTTMANGQGNTAESISQLSYSDVHVTYRDGKTVTMNSKDFHPTEKDNVVIATVEYGNGAVVHVPPTNFNPLTATDEQLDYYNYPSRPKNEADLKHWQDVMSHAKHFVIPVFGEGGNDYNQGERK